VWCTKYYWKHSYLKICLFKVCIIPGLVVSGIARVRARMNSAAQFQMESWHTQAIMTFKLIIKFNMQMGLFIENSPKRS